MLKLLVLVTLLSACLAEEEAQASASAEPVLVQHHEARGLHHLREEHHHHPMREEHHHRHHHPMREEHHHHHQMKEEHHHEDRHHRRPGARRDDIRHHEDEYHHHHLEEDHGPLILRTIRPHEHGHPDILHQDRIIEDVYSPDYAQPTWILDYRYLKTGGRDYTRGPGGQILILPKGIKTKEHKEFKNYDELIEHLKRKTLEERQKPFYFMPTGDETIAHNLGGSWKHHKHEHDHFRHGHGHGH